MHASAQEALGELGARSYQVLATVEHEQQMVGMQRFRERREHRNGRLLADPDGRGDRLRHQRRLAQGCQFHECDAVGERTVQPGRKLDGQSRLAHSGRTGQRQQPDLRSVDELAQRPKLLLPANEPRNGHRQ